jgi:hypothetical protein
MHAGCFDRPWQDADFGGPGRAPNSAARARAGFAGRRRGVYFTGLAGAVVLHPCRGARSAPGLRERLRGRGSRRVPSWVDPRRLRNPGVSDDPPDPAASDRWSSRHPPGAPIRRDLRDRLRGEGSHCGSLRWSTGERRILRGVRRPPNSYCPDEPVKFKTVREGVERPLPRRPIAARTFETDFSAERGSPCGQT